MKPLEKKDQPEVSGGASQDLVYNPIDLPEFPDQEYPKFPMPIAPDYTEK